jgi:drug/metabolite transporter (DMT)-like permease
MAKPRVRFDMTDFLRQPGFWFAGAAFWLLLALAWLTSWILYRGDLDPWIAFLYFGSALANVANGLVWRWKRRKTARLQSNELRN